MYSTCCAIENLWLAARAEGVRDGWDSILKLPQLREILGTPPHIIPVLDSVNWRRWMPLNQIIHYERWENHTHLDWGEFHECLDKASS